jgi:hypothetical protein
MKKTAGSLILFCALIIATGLVAGCVTSSRMNKLSLGMNKAEVVAAMGSPRSTAAPGGGIEILRYQLTSDVRKHQTDEYFVRLANGRVESYGKMGDFNSTKDPTLNLNVH